jgi:hypothetical protein
MADAATEVPTNGADPETLIDDAEEEETQVRWIYYIAK